MRSHSNEELPLPPAGDTLRIGMSKAIPSQRWLAVAAGTVLVVACVLALTPRAEATSSSISAVDVVGSGTIAWRKVSALAEPRADAKPVAVLKQFRPDFRPQYVLALDSLKAKKTGKPTWYRISIPGRPNGRTGWVRAGALEIRPVHKRLIVYRGAKRFEFWDGPGSFGQERSRSAPRVRRRRSASSTSPGSSAPRSTPTGRFSGRTPSRRARTRS